MIVYEIIIRLYFLAIVAASPFSAKAKKWILGRGNLREEINTANFSNHKWIWFHYSSYGEFQDGKYLMELIRNQMPEYKILITFFSSTGYELARNYTGADYVFYLPLDTKLNAGFFLEKVNPCCIFFIRNDIWPNYVYAAAKRQIPLFLAIFTLNAQSRFLKFPLRKFYLNAFQKFTGILVQDEVSQKLLIENQFNRNVIVAGNARIDRVIETGKTLFLDKTVERFIGNNFCFIAGSTHIDDRKLFVETFKQLEGEKIKWIIVPHEIDKNENDHAKDTLGETMVFYTQAEKLNEQTQVLWVDHVGMLSQLYRYADVVFIGGGFDKGGIHSMVEPLVYGCPVCFGPENRAYKEVTDLIASGGAEVVNNSKELANFILKYKRNRQLLNKVKTENKAYLLSSGGASSNILNYIIDNKYL